MRSRTLLVTGLLFLAACDGLHEGVLVIELEGVSSAVVTVRHDAEVVFHQEVNAHRALVLPFGTYRVEGDPAAGFRPPAAQDVALATYDLDRAILRYVPETRAEAHVNQAADGSSLDLQIQGVRTGVSLLGALAPPGNTACGRQARARLEELAGQRVLLERVPGYDFDERSFRLYYVFTTDGALIDEAMVREGLASAVRTEAPYGTVIAAAEAEARGIGRGCLWALDAGTP